MASKKQEVTLTAEQIENIKNYGSHIKTIEDFAEGVRKIPGNYLGDIGNNGWHSCCREIIQNAIDECLRAYSPANHVWVTFDERTQTCTIEDNGRGLPHGHIIRAIASERTSTNYDKVNGSSEYTSGVHGLGSGVAMALSLSYIVESYVLGKAKRVEFHKGKAWKYGEKDIKCPPGKQGTFVSLTPDTTILGDVNLTCNDIFALLTRLYTKMNIGHEIDFIGINKAGAIAINEQLINQDGILTDLIMITKKPIIPPICYAFDNGTMKADIAFTYDAEAITDDEEISSYANFTPTADDGTHVDGFLNGLCKFLKDYMNKIYLGEKSKLTITNNDVKTGLKAVVVAAHVNPIFKGQFKGKISNEDLKPFVEELTVKALTEWSKTKPNDLQRLAKYIKDVAEVRSKTDTEKIKLSSNYQESALGEYPKKFVKPAGKKNLEYFIVEGDSAMGSIKNGRNPAFQGVFPIRGKLPNAFSKNKVDLLNNQEVSAIIRLTTGDKVYKKNFDINKVKWDKIIILADGDPDGAHISCLVLRLFLVFMPQVIEAGKLYKAIPPLYSIGKKKKTFFIDKYDFAKFLQQQFIKTHYVNHIKSKKKFTNAEYVRFFAKNIDYAYIMNILSDTFAVSQNLLEEVLFLIADAIDFRAQSEIAVAGFAKASIASPEETKNFINESIIQTVQYNLSGLNFNKFKSTIEKKFRFVKVEKQNGIIYVQGEVNDRYQYIFINEYFIRNCMQLINIIKTNEERYFDFDGNQSTIYDIISSFDSIAPNITRYKGLGEMNENEIAESVLNPENRTLIRYTMESAKEEISNIRYIDSNFASLLNTITVTRQDIE